MFKQSLITLILTGLGLVLPTLGFAEQQHSGHSSGGGSGGTDCPVVTVSDMEPAGSAELAPGSSFTVLVAGAKSANDIKITVKKLPASITAIKKDNFFDVTAKLPAELRGTAARVLVKVKAQIVG